MAEPTQEQAAIIQLHAQLQTVVAERDNATALLGRMTLERDGLQEQIDKLRGEKIALQERCAKQTRMADDLKRQHQEQQAAKAKEHADTCARQAEQARELAAANAQLLAETKVLAGERDQARVLLARFDPEIRAEAEAKAKDEKAKRLAGLKADVERLEKELTPVETITNIG